MPQLGYEDFQRIQLVFKAMDDEYSYVRPHFKELAEFIIPRRYRSLDEGKVVDKSKAKNSSILQGTGTRAARTLSHGMSFGATSPVRPWLQLKTESNGVLAQRWGDQITRLLLEAMAVSNIYNALGEHYLDLGVFGTAALLVYRDPFTVFRAYPVPAGEYRVMHDARQEISFFSREYLMTSQQIIQRFGAQNASQAVRNTLRDNKFATHPVRHLIEPNEGALPEQFAYREVIWENSAPQGMVLDVAGHYEKPFIVSRWEVVGNDIYGVSPGMDALPDIIQLQHMVKRRGQGLDKMNAPPLAVDAALRNQPAALMPNGITYVPNSSTVGAKPIYTVNPPLDGFQRLAEELKIDINETFYNDLFRAILQLRTVRSATEIAERTEEKLVLLGPVVNRLETEALAPLVERLLGITQRAGLLPPPPGDVGGIGVRYDSILSEAQHAVGIGSIERFLSAAGNLSGLVPQAQYVVNWPEALRELGERLSVPASILHDREAAETNLQRDQELARQREQAQIGRDATEAARNLAEIDAP